MQLSDTHWGFQGPPNPDAKVTLKKAVAAVNSLEQQPDFIVFTGDLTHTTDDPAVRRQRLAEFRDIVGELKVKNVRFMPGEHDASLDKGAAYQEFFGKTHYTFDHKGVHFIVLDNVSDPGASIGEEQLAWMASDLKQLAKDQRIVVFTHRPLFDLYPEWDWATKDGAKAVELLMPYPNVTVFYGHIHQENHHNTGHIAHHAAKSLIFPLARARLAAQARPCRVESRRTVQRPGLSRSERENVGPRGHRISGAEGVTNGSQKLAHGRGRNGCGRMRRRAGCAGECGKDGADSHQKVRIHARRDHSRQGEPVILELIADDIAMGFRCKELNLRADVMPGKPAQLRFTPQAPGKFHFYCDVFCGDGHEDMDGHITVTG